MFSPNMTVELKDRNVSTDFINSFNEKLIYVGDLNKFSEEYEKITKRCVNMSVPFLSIEIIRN